MIIKSKEDIFTNFNQFIAQIDSLKLKKICRELQDYPEFWYWTGSMGHHHAYRYGLIIHTLDVTDIACHISNKFPNCNIDVLITACLWHDVAKIWDYELVNTDPTDKRLLLPFENSKAWIKSDYHGKIHHISGSLGEFTAAAKKHKLDVDTIQKIQHCIISHHGMDKNMGSPRRPEALEAIILHQSDMLSACHSEFKNCPIVI